MKTAFLFVIFFTGFAAATMAQSFSGRITDAKTHAALPYVNIGVMGKALGTVADEQGAYKLLFQEGLVNETVRVSSVGYVPRTLTLHELEAHPDVALAPEAVALGEVRVRGKALFRRTHTLGNTGNSEMATNTLTNTSLGSQVGTIIKLSRRPTRVLSATFNIARSSPGQVMFRVNLYRLDAHQCPTETKLLPCDVIMTAPVVRGPIRVELSADQLLLEEDFFSPLRC